jgi:uncharacterized protein (DUF1778 family)
MANPERTTLLINLSREQAEQIRAAAKRQDRTISAYVLRAVMARVNLERQVAATGGDFYGNYLAKVRGTK